MLYIGYLIILDGQSIKKTSFGNFHFLAAEAGKLHKQVVCPRLLVPPPPPHPNRVKNTQRGSKTCPT